MPLVPAPELEDFARRVLVAAGLDAGHADATAAGLVLANLRGVDSHGVLRLVQYEQSIRDGGINPSPQVRVVQRRGAAALVDADGGYGYAPSRLAMATAVELAAAHGIGLAGVRASHHFGMGAAYVLEAAAAGFVGWLTTTSAPVLAPTGGARPLLGNNPVACAIPRRPPHHPIVVDLALSEVAYGRVRLAAAEGREIPLGWALDEHGRPTTDAARALAAASLLPIGGHKGCGLSVVAEVLAGVLTGSPFAGGADAHGRREGGVGHLLLAIDPALFVERAAFDAGVEDLVAQIRATPLAAGAAEILLPGEPEQRTHAERSRDGIPLSDELAETLRALTERLGAGPPPWR